MSAVNVALLSCVLQTVIFSQVFPSQPTVVIIGYSAVSSLFFLVAWKIYLWPLWISPLRNLPEPPVCLAFHGGEQLEYATLTCWIGGPPIARPCEAGSE